jgi:PEGA domain
MEFLNPQAERRHRILLFIGYGLAAIAIGLVTQLFLYRLYNGYSMNINGEIDQSGLVFVSSSPSGATISLNGQSNAKTNARLSLKAGDYDMRIKAAGYREWRHEVKVYGADVQRFTYAKLFPTKLVTSTIKKIDAAPLFTSQSPNRRWLLIKEASANTFMQYDMRRPDAPVATELTLPMDTLVTAGDGAYSWAVVEWASDDQYVLLNHTYTTGEATGHEYILVDRTAPERSLNLTRTLTLTADEQLTLFDKKYDQYYSYNTQTKTLRAFESDGKQLADLLEHVIAYKTYGSDTVLYVTDLPESGKQESGTVNVVLRQGARRLVLRRLSATSPGYLLDITRFNSTWFMVAAATDAKGVYIYRNPFSQSLTGSALPQVWRFMRLQNPVSVSVSTNAQFIFAQNGQECIVYDADAVETKRFMLSRTLDAPQIKAMWMDGHRLTYVAGGKLIVVEYDNQNLVELQAALPQYGAYFSADYDYSYALAPGDGAAVQLTSTPLIVKK